MKALNAYLFNLAVSLDQFIGAFIPGSYPDETVSSRAFRENWKVQHLFNFMFFDSKHCENSYWSEVHNRQSFPRS